jgi:adenylate cyclase
MQSMIREWWQKTWLVLVVLAICVLISKTGFWRQLEHKGFDWLTVATASGKIDLPIIIIGIDEPSFGNLEIQWPWPRGVHGHLVDALKKSGAAVIGFDIVFAEQSDAEQDQLFAQAVNRAQNVVMASDLIIQQRDRFEFVQQVNPMAAFIKAGGKAAISTISPDKDLVVRKIPDYDKAFWRVIVETYHKKTGVPLAMPDFSKSLRVKYLGPDHGFMYASYYQALEPEKMLPPNIFKDKIVLIGFDVKTSPEPGMQRADSFGSPFMRQTGWLTPGVEIHANFVANALLGCHIQVLDGWPVVIGVMIVLMLTLVGTADWSPVKASLCLIMIIAAVCFFSFILFGHFNRWLPAGSMVLAAVLFYLFQGGIAFVRERSQRRAIRGAFKRYVPPQVVEQMIRHPEKLQVGGMRSVITLVFTDIVGFTTISENMDPEDLGRLINEYFTRMTRIILEYGGTVDKYIGDAIMAFWGAPLDDPDQALHAVQASMKMQEACVAMRKELEERDLPAIRMRIGIHTGEAIVGNMGSDQRFDYSALGDTVNLASHLEGINKNYGTELMISEATREKLSGQIPVIFVDSVVVKGKTKPVNIFTPISDLKLRQLAKAAFKAYDAQDWVEAEQLFSRLKQNQPLATIASLYLDRIKQHIHIKQP